MSDGGKPVDTGLPTAWLDEFNSRIEQLDSAGRGDGAAKWCPAGVPG